MPLATHLAALSLGEVDRRIWVPMPQFSIFSPVLACRSNARGLGCKTVSCRPSTSFEESTDVPVHDALPKSLSRHQRRLHSRPGALDISRSLFVWLTALAFLRGFFLVY